MFRFLAVAGMAAGWLVACGWTETALAGGSGNLPSSFVFHAPCHFPNPLRPLNQCHSSNPCFPPCHHTLGTPLCPRTNPKQTLVIYEGMELQLFKASNGHLFWKLTFHTNSLDIPVQLRLRLDVTVCYGQTCCQTCRTVCLILPPILLAPYAAESEIDEENLKKNVASGGIDYGVQLLNHGYRVVVIGKSANWRGVKGIYRVNRQGTAVYGFGTHRFHREEIDAWAHRFDYSRSGGSTPTSASMAHPR